MMRTLYLLLSVSAVLYMVATLANWAGDRSGRRVLKDADGGPAPGRTAPAVKIPELPALPQMPLAPPKDQGKSKAVMIEKDSGKRWESGDHLAK